jgi:hypothetical protein
MTRERYAFLGSFQPSYLTVAAQHIACAMLVASGLVNMLKIYSLKIAEELVKVTTVPYKQGI